MFMKVYHVDNGEAEMYEVDAHTAVREHPLEWSKKPWSDEARDKAKAELKKKNDKGEDTQPELTPVSTQAVRAPAVGAVPPGGKKYEAKHRGGGSYSIMDGQGDEVLEKLSKEDAELFNAGSLADQEAFIQAEQAKRA